MNSNANDAAFARNKTVQSYLLREKRRVFLSVQSSRTGHQTSDRLIAAIQADLSQLGIALGRDIVEPMRAMSDAELSVFYPLLVTLAKESVGANVRYRPLFKNFPLDVPEDDFEHFIKRLFGYLESHFNVRSDEHTVLSCGHVVNHRVFDLETFGACPICQHQVAELDGGEDSQREDLDELTPMKLLRMASTDDVWVAFEQLARARTSLSESQKDFLNAVIACDAQQAAARLPQEMPFKENAALTLAALLKAGCTNPELFGHIKTATDVLRTAVALCGGDVSLKETTRFKLSNAHRRFLMQAFEALPHKAAHLQEEMLGYRGRWLRLGEVLHVGQFKRHVPKMAECFDVLRNCEKSITTHASRVESLLNGGKLQHARVQAELLAALAQRPGEFARKLDVLLQRGLPFEDVKSSFQAVAPNVGTNVLLTLLKHLEHRSRKAGFRAFMPKGVASKMYILDADKRKALDAGHCQALRQVVRAELLRRFAERPSLGKVYVSDSLRGALVPFSQRSASTGLTPMTRGSRLHYDSRKGFLRMFLNWKETSETGTIDVDLTCGLYSADWSYLDHLSWTNTRSVGRSAHSGDVRSGSGPHGAAEFIDLDIEALKRRGVRYAAVTVFSWTGQKFSDFPCFAGFMEREEPTKGRAFEARTVKHKFEVSGDRVVLVPMFADLETGEVVWCDMGLKARNACNAIENANSRIVQLNKAIDALGQSRMSLQELFQLHAQARGELVAEREGADLVLDEAKLFELDDVIANWL
jgi:hypothetical protein